jgi:hypothetical protein
LCGCNSICCDWGIGGIPGILNVCVELEHGMLVEKIGKADLLVGNEGSNLSGKVCNCAGDESGV